MLDIVNLTTGSESPWQNGLCEKNHAIIDNILERLDEDYPHLDLDSKLAWAGMAKNSLQMTYGFSPNQLVFGTNPRLPNIATGGPSTWEEGTCSESLAKHLNLLHASRREFLKSESCSKLKIALKAKIRCMETVYNNGDIVYYKRARDGKWMGPGKVVFQDGKVIFVRNGATFIRVSANRIVKAGSELAKSILANEDIQEIDHNQNLDTLTDTTSLSVEGNSLSETVQSSEIVEISEDNNNTDNNHEVTTISSDRIKVKKDDKVRFREGEGQFMYTGFQIKQDSEGIMIDQNQYLENLEVEDINPARVRHKNDDLDENEKTKIRKMAGSLNWIVRGTRPDKSFELIDASTKFQTGKIEDLVRLRKTLVSMKENKAEIYFPNLGDPVGWTLVCFTDAALGNLNNGKDSTGGHIVLLMNTPTNMCSVLRLAVK